VSNTSAPTTPEERERWKAGYWTGSDQGVMARLCVDVDRLEDRNRKLTEALRDLLELLKSMASYPPEFTSVIQQAHAVLREQES
jgi:hypothetical protein